MVLEELGRAVAPVPFLGSCGAGRPRALLGTRATRCSTRSPRAAAIATLAVPLSAAPGARHRTGDRRRRPARRHRDQRGRRRVAPTCCWCRPAGRALRGRGRRRRRGRRRWSSLRPDPPAHRRHAATACPAGWSRADAAGRGGRGAAGRGRRCSPPSSSGVAEWCLDDDRRLRQDAPPVRPAGRLVPGGQAPARRPVGRASPRPARWPATRPTASRPATPDLPVAAALAQAYCSPVAVKAAEECVQLHGGIGFTWEHPAHLYLKRARSNAVTFGSAASHRAALADLAGLPAWPARDPGRCRRSTGRGSGAAGGSGTPRRRPASRGPRARS